MPHFSLLISFHSLWLSLRARIVSLVWALHRYSPNFFVYKHVHLRVRRFTVWFYKHGYPVSWVNKPYYIPSFSAFFNASVYLGSLSNNPASWGHTRVYVQRALWYSTHPCTFVPRPSPPSLVSSGTSMIDHAWSPSNASIASPKCIEEVLLRLNAEALSHTRPQGTDFVKLERLLLLINVLIWKYVCVHNKM